MLIKFKNLKLHNFLSFGDAELNLENLGYTLVCGVNNNITDNALSNGSGKSSIWEAISWNLTGETIRGIKDVVNRFTEGGCFVELSFNIDKDEYKVVRYKEYSNYGTNLKIFINGEDKSGKGIRDTQQLLETYLPDLTSQLLGSVIILGQGLPQRFTNNTPAGRKEVLEKLSKSDFMIDDIKEKLSNRKSELSENLRKVEDGLLSNESKKSILEKNLQKLKDDKVLLDNQPDYDSEIEKYEKQLNFLESQQIDTYNYSRQLNEKLNNKLDEYQKWVSSVQNNILSESVHIEEDEGLVDIDKVIKQNEFYISNKEQEILKLESVKDICPTCGQHLPDVHKVDTTKLREELEEIKADNSKIVEQRNQIKEIVDSKIQQLKDDLNSTAESIKKEGQELRKLYNDVSKQNEEYVNEISNVKLTLEKIKLNKENYEKQSKTIEDDIRHAEDEIKNFSEKILYNNIDKDNIKSHIDVVTKMMTFATRDFRGYLLSEVISFINKKSKEYCKDVFNNDKIDFYLDGNNINITYNEKQYEALSGGEKQKIDIIIQFAIRDMLVQFLDFSSNILVLDEIFDNLDNIGCQKILDLINNKLTDIENIFIITHHSDISIPYDSIIKVIKDERGVSNIEGN